MVIWISIFNICPKKNVHNIFRFTEFGGTIRQRPVEDLAFAVARFVQKGGSFINYYMVCHEKESRVHYIYLRSLSHAYCCEVLMTGDLLVFVNEVSWRNKFWTYCWGSLHHYKL